MQISPVRLVLIQVYAFWDVLRLLVVPLEGTALFHCATQDYRMRNRYEQEPGKRRSALSRFSTILWYLTFAFAHYWGQKKILGLEDAVVLLISLCGTMFLCFCVETILRRYKLVPEEPTCLFSCVWSPIIEEVAKLLLVFICGLVVNCMSSSQYAWIAVLVGLTFNYVEDGVKLLAPSKDKEKPITKRTILYGVSCIWHAAWCVFPAVQLFPVLRGAGINQLLLRFSVSLVLHASWNCLHWHEQYRLQMMFVNLGAALIALCIVGGEQTCATQLARLLTAYYATKV